MSEQAPKKLTPQMVGAAKGVAFVHAAVGRSHTLLVGSNGDVWGAGANAMGQVRPQPVNIAEFSLIHYEVWTTSVCRSTSIH